MHRENWKHFHPYFTAAEAWGDPGKVAWEHVWLLYSIRMFFRDYMNLDWPMKIHCCYELTGHEINSWHKKGKATDFHFVTDYSFADQCETLDNAISKLGICDFVGLGKYPDWNNPGFHIDNRGKKSRWTFENGVYRYEDSSDERR